MWDWWQIAQAAGCRTLAVDVPQTVPRKDSGGVQICDWATHDRAWAPASEPPGALAEAMALVGGDPIGDCDGRVRGKPVAAYEGLRLALVDRVQRRTRLVETLVAREPWDVAYVVYAETHCAGHQFWGFRDPTTAPYLREGSDALRHAVDEVYREVDRGIGRLIAAAGPAVDVIVIASHGMAKYVGGYQLLPEVLGRLGLRPRPGRARSGLGRRAPRRLRALAGRIVATEARERILASLGERPEHDLQRPVTLATVMPNNRCGAIRLNLRGREPHGSVEPGAEAAALVELLRNELYALTDPRTGQPIVTSVDTPADSGRAHLHPDLPDITVDFRTDLGPLESCTSPRIGTVEAPLWRRTSRSDWPLGMGRTGDHTPSASRAWVRAHGVEPTASVDPPSVIDLAPTALALLGVPVPGSMEGRTQLVRVTRRASPPAPAAVSRTGLR
jgi:predicted AlkP superfamily phosphohydrolase/phosphomutase